MSARQTFYLAGTLAVLAALATATAIAAAASLLGVTIAIAVAGLVDLVAAL